MRTALLLPAIFFWSLKLSWNTWLLIIQLLCSIFAVDSLLIILKCYWICVVLDCCFVNYFLCLLLDFLSVSLSCVNFYSSLSVIFWASCFWWDCICCFLEISTYNRKYTYRLTIIIWWLPTIMGIKIFFWPCLFKLQPFSRNTHLIFYLFFDIWFESTLIWMFILNNLLFFHRWRTLLFFTTISALINLLILQRSNSSLRIICMLYKNLIFPRNTFLFIFFIFPMFLFWFIIARSISLKWFFFWI